jgi:glycosyltransferase involved in cell wall biosynthesis
MTFAIRAAAPGASLLIAGDGPRDAVPVQAGGRTGSGLTASSLLGHVDRAAARIYGAVDDVNCSDREGIANVLLESLVCGTPLVATRVGSPEIRARRVVGRRPPGLAIAASMASRILASSTDPRYTRRFGELYH